MRISIIICTHNPERPVLARCLEAVARLNSPADDGVEVILVDNHSAPPLESDADVTGFLKAAAGRVLVPEPRLGLTYARLAGFRRASGDWIVFFDDDNFPEPDYLEGLRQLAQKHPEVGVWGPGVVEVVWEDGVGKWARNWAAVFQARQRTETTFGRVAGWPDYYPAGTGMAVRRNILEAYAGRIESGALSAVDRCGKRMTSGGDGQIVWMGVKLGLAAGTGPELRLQHFTARRKARLKYVLRLLFGVMSSGQTALAESFPEEREKMRATIPGGGKVNMLAVGKFFRLLCALRLRTGPIVLVEWLGQLHGKHVATGTPLPWSLRLAERWLS